MTIQGMTPAVALSIPSPNWSGWSVGHVTIHMYAICILAGIIVAYVLGTKRYEAVSYTHLTLPTIYSV